jgi:hypothetical protein
MAPPHMHGLSLNALRRVHDILEENVLEYAPYF